MVIGSFLTPVGCEQVYIEVPALDFCFAFRRDFHGARAQGHRRQSGWAAQAFLRPAVNSIHLPLVDFNRATSEGSDCIEEEQSPGLVCDARDFLHRRERAGGSFRMDNGDELRLASLERLGDLSRLNDAAPRSFDAGDFCAATFGDIDHAIAKYAVGADDDFIPTLDQIDEAKLHPGAASAAA